MTFTPDQVAKVYIFAAKLAREKAALEARVKGHRDVMETVLPGHLSADVLAQARAHYRGLVR